MDFLDPNENNSLPDPEEAEVRLDLRGVEQQDALSQLDKMMADCQNGSVASLLVRFDPATPDSGETLFQPVGQQLRDAKKQGTVKNCFPVLDEQSAGFYVVFKI